MKKLKQYYSKLTVKCQAGIPKEVREILNLKGGDHIVFEVDEENNITLKKGKITIKIETED